MYDMRKRIFAYIVTMYFVCYFLTGEIDFTIWSIELKAGALSLTAFLAFMFEFVKAAINDFEIDW